MHPFLPTSPLQLSGSPEFPKLILFPSPPFLCLSALSLHMTLNIFKFYPSPPIPLTAELAGQDLFRLLKINECKHVPLSGSQSGNLN